MTLVNVLFVAGVILAVAAWWLGWIFVRYDPLGYVESMRSRTLNRYTVTGLFVWLGLLMTLVFGLWSI